MQCGDTEYCTDRQLSVWRSEYFPVPSCAFCTGEPGEVSKRDQKRDEGDRSAGDGGADQPDRGEQGQGRDQARRTDHPVSGHYPDDDQRPGAFHYRVHVY